MRLARTIGDWLEERVPWRGRVRAWLDPPAMGGAPWASALGAAVATCVGVLALTGLLLMTAYAPSPQSAWASVHYVQFVQDRGWIIRGLHYWAAQSLLVLAAAHIVHGAVTAAYRKPGEIAWWLTLAVLGLAVAEGITGGLLPWDQRGWWARVVEGNIVGLAPVVGGFIEQMMSGGPELGALGLSRAFTLHVTLLPLAIAGALVGRRAPIGRRQPIAFGVLVAGLVVCALFAVSGWAHGAPLEGPADATSDYPARPEWFLLTLFELRKFFHGSGQFWGTTLVPAAAAGYLVLLPWMDRAPRSRALVVAPALAIFAVAIGLGAYAYHHDAGDAKYLEMRAASDRRAAAAIALAKRGVPPAGPLEMMRHDPEMRGRELFERHCASCHVLGDLGDPEKATATRLEGWTTAAWIRAMIHDPDAPEHFGRGPYKGEMPSVDKYPADKPGEPWTPMVKSEAEMKALTTFLASQGDEPDDPPTPLDAAERALGEKIVTERCTSCHLFKGEGDDEGSGIAPELARYGSVAWTRAQVANPASPQTYRDNALDPARKKHMPRFDKDLSAEDLDIVARWTRAHARGLPLP
jgi:ubiquinol-cytochrome c reductase cytochrome b subunit